MRLVANDAVVSQQRIDCEYDWQGRRISKKVWNNTAGSGTPLSTRSSCTMLEPLRGN